MGSLRHPPATVGPRRLAAATRAAGCACTLCAVPREQRRLATARRAAGLADTHAAQRGTLPQGRCWQRAAMLCPVRLTVETQGRCLEVRSSAPRLLSWRRAAPQRGWFWSAPIGTGVAAAPRTGSPAASRHSSPRSWYSGKGRRWGLAEGRPRGYGCVMPQPARGRTQFAGAFSRRPRPRRDRSSVFAERGRSGSLMRRTSRPLPSAISHERAMLMRCAWVRARNQAE